MRLHAQTAAIENGFVHLPLDAPWLEGYLHELLTFPNGRHDDQVELDGPGAGLVPAARLGTRAARLSTAGWWKRWTDMSA